VVGKFVFPKPVTFARTLEENLARAKAASLLAARSRQKLFADEKRREVELAVGQSVLLSTINFQSLRIQGRASCYPSGWDRSK
jgi:hypothetical protein